RGAPTFPKKAPKLNRPPLHLSVSAKNIPVPCPNAEKASMLCVENRPYSRQLERHQLVSLQSGRRDSKASFRYCSLKRASAASVMLGASTEACQRAFQPTVTSGSE